MTGTYPLDPLDFALCGMARDAYAEAPTLVAAGDVHAVVRDIAGMPVVAFRGTVPLSWADWLRDFASWPHTDRGHPALGRCHDGFLTGALSVFPGLQKLLPVAMPYAITGHSLGGALAIVTGALMQSIGNPPLRLTTFGAPRVGIGDTLHTLLGPIAGLRFRRGDDPVPTVPAWPYANDRDWTPVGAAGFPRIEDHMIAGYLADFSASR